MVDFVFSFTMISLTPNIYYYDPVTDVRLLDTEVWCREMANAHGKLTS